MTGIVKSDVPIKSQQEMSHRKGITEERLMEELLTKLGRFKEPTRDSEALRTGNNGKLLSPRPWLKQEEKAAL